MEIKREIIEEGNIRAVKDTDGFGGPNMWSFEVKNTGGFFCRVQWMHISSIQKFFNTKLTVYSED